MFSICPNVLFTSFHDVRCPSMFPYNIFLSCRKLYHIGVKTWTRRETVKPRSSFKDGLNHMAKQIGLAKGSWGSALPAEVLSDERRPGIGWDSEPPKAGSHCTCERWIVWDCEKRGSWSFAELLCLVKKTKESVGIMKKKDSEKFFMKEGASSNTIS